MKEIPFTIKGALQEGWRLTKENMGFLFVFQFILYLLVLITGRIQETSDWAVWGLIGWFVVVLTKIGLYRSTLLIADGIKPGLDQLYQNWQLFFSWVVASFLFGIMFILGLVLLIIPAFYVGARYGFFPFFILDKNSGPLEALSQSAQATEGIRWPIFLLFLACMGLNLLGLLFFGIGLFITVPVTLIALAKVYRKLTQSNTVLIEPINNDKR